MTGNRTAHPLLISLANIHMNFRMKGTNHAFHLLALLPVAKFIHKNKRICGVLQDRLTHEVLDFVLQPLKTAATIGVMMSDPLGNLRYCFTPLAAYIVDTPEAQMLSGVGGRASPVTMARYKQLGDPFRHEPRSASTTLAHLLALESEVNPSDIVAYVQRAKTFHLNGVHQPFWRDWPLSDPSIFLTPEPLHHWHKQFWDHDLKWAIRVLGEEEIDFRFSILQPISGYRHFKEGISKLKQVTGRDHRNIQRFLVGIISDIAPKNFVIAIRALMDFRYLAQASVISAKTCRKISAALKNFHDHKHVILTCGARVGKRNRVIDNWYIPKLELMQSVVPNIHFNGVPIQFSADITEHTHITDVKKPVRSSNNHQDDSQICRYLDRQEKCRNFDLATATRYMQPDFPGRLDEEVYDSDDANDELNEDNSMHVDVPVSNISASHPLFSNYFEEAERVEQNPRALVPYRTFDNLSTAFHLIRDPNSNHLSIDDAAFLYVLPDLRPALHELFHRIISRGTGMEHTSLPIGGHRAAPSSMALPFDALQVWYRIRIQKRAFHYPHSVSHAQTVHAHPPCDKWKLGRYDTVIVNTNSLYSWPKDGLKGR
jgi:hypothetical protein